MARAYPVHLCLDGRSALVVGAGRVAQRRVARLLEAGARPHVVAPEATHELRERAREGALRWSARAFEPADCAGERLVFVATGDAEVNAQVEQAARAAGALVNRADAPERSDFWVPATAHGERCTASLATGGRAPSAARRLSRELNRWLQQGPERFVRAVEQAREVLKGRDHAATRLRALADGPLFDACCVGDELAVRRLVRSTCAEGSDG